MRTHKIENTLIVFVFVLLLVYIYNQRCDRVQDNHNHTEQSRLKREVTRAQSNIFTALGYITYEKTEQDIFKPLGLILEDSTPLIAKLKYNNQPQCNKIYSDWLELSKNYNESALPPRKIPNNWKYNYTMKGYAHLKMGYSNERSGVKKATWDMIERFITAPLEFFVYRPINYYDNGLAMYYAMQYHGVEGLDGAVVGSLTPWVESFALRNGAKEVTTIEYMKIDIVGTDRVKYIHPIKLAENAEDYFGKFQFVASFSSLEHSGLGRYGDVPDPIGDIREMLKIRCLIADGGLLYLGLPVGPDALEWNLHRIYGRIRLAIMFAGFELLSIFEKENNAPIELTEADFGPKVPLFRWYRQPVFVLRKVE